MAISPINSRRRPMTKDPENQIHEGLRVNRSMVEVSSSKEDLKGKAPTKGVLNTVSTEDPSIENEISDNSQC